MKKQDINNFIEPLNNLSSCFLPISLALIGIRKGMYNMKKMYFEDKLKDIDRKEIFCYLIEDRIFINSLSSEEIKKYYKYLRTCYKNRIIEKIKNFFIKYLLKRKVVNLVNEQNNN